MVDTNVHGLTRTIPESVKRELRRRCGFGCVICGFGIYDYEHFEPDFAQATKHNADGMTLLCPSCNQKRARGRLSRETVALANQNPICIRKGFANDIFDFHSNPIKIKFAGVTFLNTEHVVMVNFRSILSVRPPKEDKSPVLLSGIFCDSIGREVLSIHENEWSVTIDNWDVECIGPKITIRNGPGKIVLIIRMDAPKCIIIERFDMLFEGIRFLGDDKNLKWSADGNNWTTWSGESMSDGKAAIFIVTRPPAANDNVY